MKQAGNVFAGVGCLTILGIVVVVILLMTGAFSGGGHGDPAKHFKVGRDVAARIVPVESKAKGEIVLTKRYNSWRCDVWVGRELCFDGNGVLRYDGAPR